MVRQCLSQRANHHSIEPISGGNALHIAVRNADLKMVRMGRMFFHLILDLFLVIAHIVSDFIFISL